MCWARRSIQNDGANKVSAQDVLHRNKIIKTWIRGGAETPRRQSGISHRKQVCQFALAKGNRLFLQGRRREYPTTLSCIRYECHGIKHLQHQDSPTDLHPFTVLNERVDHSAERGQTLVDMFTFYAQSK